MLHNIMKHICTFENYVESNSQEINEASIGELQKMLSSHDWYYMYSDDNRAWERGIDSEKKILDLVKKLGSEAEKLYKDEHQKRFSNKK